MTIVKPGERRLYIIINAQTYWKALELAAKKMMSKRQFIEYCIKLADKENKANSV